MPPRLCLICHQPTTNGSRCEQHDNAWNTRPSPASRGYGGDWPKISKAVIAEHVARYGWLCPGLGDHEAHLSHDLTTDHILPVEEGGTNQRVNLRVLCRSANTGRAIRASNERRRA